MPCKTILLFPPVGDPYQPYLSLPSLAAFLRAAGREVIQRDLNIEAYEAFLSAPRLTAAQQAVAVRLAVLEAQPHLDAAERAEYDALCRSHLTAAYTIEHIAAAKAALRSAATFYDPDCYAAALAVIGRAMALLSAEHYPTDWTLDHFHTRHTQGWAWRATGLLEIIENERENPFVRYFREELGPWLAAEQPDLVGVSITYFGQLVPGLTLARAIKAAAPNAHVCVGGAVFTELTPQIERNPALLEGIDSIVTYEGEHTLLALVECLERGAPLERVPGLHVILPGGRMAVNPGGATEDVNLLPTPDYDGLPLKLYFAPEPVFLLATSRGCYWKRCAFCTVSTAMHSACYRPRRPELVKQDVQTLQSRYGARCIFLSEDSVAPIRLRMVADAVSELAAPIAWECETRLEGLTPELCRHIARHGCRRLIFGLESAVQRVLDLMDKGTRLENIETALRLCAEAGIAVNMQTFVGFPGETEAEARATLQFLLDNRTRIQSLAFGAFLLQQGSRVQQDPARYGVTEITYPPDDVLATCYDYRVETGMSSTDARQIVMEGLPQIAVAYPRLRAFSGHDSGAHSLLYLVHYGLPDLRRIAGAPGPQAPPLPAAGLAAQVPCVPADISYRRYRVDGNGETGLLVYRGRAGHILAADLQTEAVLALCDGRRSVGQIAERLAGECATPHQYFGNYSRALSTARTCIAAGILEVH